MNSSQPSLNQSSTAVQIKIDVLYTLPTSFYRWQVFASSGLVVMALFSLFYPQRPRLAYQCWLGGITCGMLMGFGQIMRGADFLSHNLRAGWWVWFSQLAVYWWVSGYFSRKTR